MKLGILRTDTVRPELADEFGQYPDMFRSLLGAVDDSIEFATFDVERDEFPDTIEAADAYLITGSRFSAYDNEPWIHRLLAFVRELHRARMKVVGICFGHQIIALALGGVVEKSERGWGVGLHKAKFDTRPTWHDRNDPSFHVLVSHQDQVTQLPQGMTRLAGSAFCPNAVAQVGAHMLTFQGHPEFVTGYSRALIEFRRQTLDEERYHDGLASLTIAPERERIARWIVDFLRRP